MVDNGYIADIGELPQGAHGEAGTGLGETTGAATERAALTLLREVLQAAEIAGDGADPVLAGGHVGTV